MLPLWRMVWRLPVLWRILWRRRRRRRRLRLWRLLPLRLCWTPPSVQTVIKIRSVRILEPLITTKAHRMIFLVFYPQQQQPLQPTPTLPLTVDLRPKMPPIDDQLSLGACSADAIVAAVEYKCPGFLGSRLFVYYNERLLSQTVNSDSGSSIENGMKVVSTYGVCDEALYPYRPDHFTDVPSPEAYTNALLHKVLAYSKLPLDMNALKNCLVGGNPFIASIIIYSSFQRTGDIGGTMIPMPMANQDSLGGHAVLICGYDDSLQSWILRNSWGLDWGVRGYCYLPYLYLLDSSLCSECWVVSSVSAPNSVLAPSETSASPLHLIENRLTL